MTMTVRVSRSLCSLAACLVCVAALGGVALAQSGGRASGASANMIDTLKAADANTDGLLTEAELTAALKDRFSRMDRNRDGLVKPDDAPPFARKQFNSRVAPVIAERDANGDGTLSYAEFSKPSMANFLAADSDGDGQVEVSALVDRARVTAR